jgi:hypothetical protein
LFSFSLPHLGFPEEAQCLFSSQKTLKWLLHESKKRLSKLLLHLQSKEEIHTEEEEAEAEAKWPTWVATKISKQMHSL